MSWKFWLVRRVSELTCLSQKRNTDSEILKYMWDQKHFGKLTIKIDDPTQSKL